MEYECRSQLKTSWMSNSYLKSLYNHINTMTSKMKAMFHMNFKGDGNRAVGSSIRLLKAMAMVMVAKPSFALEGRSFLEKHRSAAWRFDYEFKAVSDIFEPDNVHYSEVKHTHTYTHIHTHTYTHIHTHTQS